MATRRVSQWVSGAGRRALGPALPRASRESVPSNPLLLLTVFNHFEGVT